MTSDTGPRDSSKYVQVIIPAYNESSSIGAVLESIPLSAAGFPLRVLVVDDGSIDDTSQIAKEIGAEVIAHLKNFGQGAAIRTGFRASMKQGCVVALSLDADGQHDPREAGRLLEPILRNEADFVIGSRFIGSTSLDDDERLLGIRLLSFIISLVTGQLITDPTNGFRAIRTSRLEHLRLREERFNSLEIIIQAKRNRLRILEVPVTVRERLAGQTKKPRVRYITGLLRALLRSFIA